MKQNLPRFDAAESAYLSRQLDYIKQQTYDIKYAELKCRKLIPISTEANPGAERIFYRTYDQSAMGKIIANYGDDLPRADVKGTENFVNVRTLGASYGYNFQELKASTYANLPLEQRRANAARRAVAQVENNVAFFGDANFGIQGLFNNPQATTISLPADGNNSGYTNSKLWAAKTPDQILRDMNLIANSIVSSTFGVEMPDTLLLPLSNFNFVASTARSINSDTTILNYFLNNNPYIKNVEWVNELGSAGTGGTAKAVAYRRSPDVLTMEVPSDFEQHEIEHRNLEYIINCTERFGGVIIYYPLAVAYAEGL